MNIPDILRMAAVRARAGHEAAMTSVLDEVCPNNPETQRRARAAAEEHGGWIPDEYKGPHYAAALERAADAVEAEEQKQRRTAGRTGRR